MFAWLLAALWLPASLHCTAESAGWFDEADCCGHAAQPLTGDSAELDHCETLAAGVPREDLAPAVAVLPPDGLPLWLHPIVGAPPPEPPATAGERTQAPPHVLACWAHAHRVVAPARAP